MTKKLIIAGIIIVTSPLWGLCMALLFFYIRDGMRSWQELPSEGLPWAGKNQRAKLFTKEISDWNNGSKTITRWGTESRKVSNGYTLVEAEFDFLRSTNRTSEWEQGSSIGTGGQNVNSMFAPFRFCIVNVFPTITLMTPDSTRLKNGYTEIPPQSIVTPSLTSWVDYGVTIPYDDKVYWFSSEMNQVPVLLIHNGKLGEIKLPDGKLIFTRVEERWVITRE